MGKGWARGVPKSAEHREKIAEAQRGKPRSAAACQRMRTFWRSLKGQAKRAALNRESWKDPAIRRRRIDGIITALHHPDVRGRHLTVIQRNAKARNKEIM